MAASFFLVPGLLVLTLGISGCVTKRTVTERGHTVEEKYVVKRPVKKFINNVEFE
jgi:hypothetical protein